MPITPALTTVTIRSPHIAEKSEATAVRLTELIAGYTPDMQRHIHTAVVRAVGNGTLRGYKLSDRFSLPHCHDVSRRVSKSDIAFEPQDVVHVRTLMSQTIDKYSILQAMPSSRPSFAELKSMTVTQKNLLLEQQQAQDRRMKNYRR